MCQYFLHMIAQNNCIHVIISHSPVLLFLVPVFHISHLSVFYLYNSVYSVDAKGVLDPAGDYSIFCWH